MKRILQILLPAFIVVAGSAHAIDAIPEKPGWHGFLMLGAGVLQAETNMVAGIDLYSIDIGNARIDSVGEEPEKKSILIPQVNFNVNYTFSTQTQLFLGNSLENIVQLDTVTIGGVRQQFSDKSILELGFVSSPMLAPVQVWADPYVVGVDRVKTDRTSRGIRLEYDKILGSGFGVRLEQRETEIDNELSGTTGGLGLTAAEAELMKRSGDVKSLLAYYRFSPVGRNVFELRLGYGTDDLDGKAMSGDRNLGQLTYAYFGKRFISTANVSYMKQEFDAVNPVFNQLRDDKSLGLAFFLFDKDLFNSKQWWGQASLVWIGKDSNIDFYDQSSSVLTAGVKYTF